LALDNLVRGLDEIAINEAALERDLFENWEVLGEAIQTVIRAEVARGKSKISDPYALLKELTRGKKIGEKELVDFVSKLDIPADSKKRLIALRPNTYVGIAKQLVKLIS
jgi:adenylosuccinate lyase